MALCQARQSYPGSDTGQLPSLSQYTSNLKKTNNQAWRKKISAESHT